MRQMARELPEVPGVEHAYPRLRGFRMHVASAGDPDAPAVVLLHGWPQHWWMWRELIGPLATERRVICPDLRGFGWSEAPAGSYEKQVLADDVLALLDHLELDRVALVGHDWGGWVSYLLCLGEPQRFSRLLALNILPPFVPATPRSVLSTWRLWYQWILGGPLGSRAARGLGAAAGRRVASWVGTDAWSEEERDAFLGQFTEPARAAATVRLYRDFQLHELPQLVRGRYHNARLQVPCRIVFGAGDHTQDAALLRGIERFGDDLSVEVVPDAGHFIVDERPELVLRHARDFLL